MGYFFVQILIAANSFIAFRSSEASSTCKVFFHVKINSQVIRINLLPAVEDEGSINSTGKTFRIETVQRLRKQQQGNPHNPDLEIFFSIALH